MLQRKSDVDETYFQMTAAEDTCRECSDISEEHHIERKPQSTELASLIQKAANLSLSQTVKVLNVLYEKLGDQPLMTPTRSALWKAHRKLQNSETENN